jgi:hypothetical protein
MVAERLVCLNELHCGPGNSQVMSAYALAARITIDVSVYFGECGLGYSRLQNRLPLRAQLLELYQALEQGSRPRLTKYS